MFASKQTTFRMVLFVALCTCCVILVTERFLYLSVHRSRNSQAERLLFYINNVVRYSSTDRVLYEDPKSSLDYNFTPQAEYFDVSAGQNLIYSRGFTRTCSALFAGDKNTIKEVKRLDHQHRYVS